METIITQQGDRPLYSCIMGGLKMENISEWITNLSEIDKVLVIIIIRLVIHILLFKKWLANSAKYEKLMNKIKSLGRITTDRI